ncbi:hypothetical protein D3C71_1774300 [compost metagenome]
MRFELVGVGDLIDVERVLVDAGNLRAEQPASCGKHQAVVAEALRGRVGVRADKADLPSRNIDVLHEALDEPDADRLEDILQRRLHAERILFVEARANVQFGRWREHGDFHVGSANLVQQASRGQGAPHAGKAGAYDKNAFGHISNS